MAVIYLRHEQHGCKVATAEAEAAYDMRNGWKIFYPQQIVEEAANVDADEPAAIVNAMMPRRRGRRPKNPEN